MRPTTQATAQQERLIERAGTLLQEDRRVAACWLEGSFASGSADAWSDVDLHVAVYDDRFDDFFSERLDILNRFGTVLGYGESPLPGGAHLVFASVAGPVRVDLYIERLSAIESALRWERPRLLFDREAIAANLRATGDVNALLPQWLEGLVRNFFFGAMWPVRMWGREEWGSLLMNCLAITFQFLVPAMLAQDDPRNYYRPHYHNEHRLKPERRREVQALLGQIVEAFRDIGTGGVDDERLVRLHEVLLGRIWQELRAACAKWGVVYPEAAEQEMREYYERELGIKIGRS